MEPSFWSWEKQAPTTSPTCISGLPQWSPAFGAGKSRNHRQPHLVHPAAMEPSFWSWEKDQLDVTDLGRGRAAMEPSFWSWEKPSKSKPTSSRILGRNGAQLLELGKGPSPKRW